MKRRFISKWVVQKVVREAAEDMGILGATPELISEKVKELAGAHLPNSIVEKALEDMGDEFYEGEDELFEEEYRERKKRERMGKIYSSISLVFAGLFFVSGALLGVIPSDFRPYYPFFLGGSVIFGFLTAIFSAILASRYVTWRCALGLLISLEAQLIYTIILNI